MNTNCKSCNAPIPVGVDKCEYCGTALALEVDKDFVKDDKSSVVSQLEVIVKPDSYISSGNSIKPEVQMNSSDSHWTAIASFVISIIIFLAALGSEDKQDRDTISGFIVLVALAYTFNHLAVRNFNIKKLVDQIQLGIDCNRIDSVFSQPTLKELKMAFDKLNLKNPNTGEIKQAPVGYSWTTLFFGPFVPLFRADWLMAVILFGVAMVTAGISNIVFSFIYNKLYIKNLIYKDGFKVTGSNKGNLQLISNKLGIELPQI